MQGTISNSAISRAQVVPLIRERLRDPSNRRLTAVRIWHTADNGSGPRQVCKVRIRHP